MTRAATRWPVAFMAAAWCRSGYRRGADGRLRVNSRIAPHVRQAFAMRAAGASLQEVGMMPREQRVESACGTCVWGPSTVARLFANRVYLGEVTFGDYTKAGAHVPLVDETTFRLAQYQPAARKQPPRPGLLYGIARCASCGSYLNVYSSGL